MVIPRPQTNVLHISVMFRGAVVWNKLPDTIRNEKEHSIFKKMIRQLDVETMDFNTYTNNKDDTHTYIYIYF